MVKPINKSNKMFGMDMIKDNSGYATAIIALMGTIIIAYVMVIIVLPVNDQLQANFETNFDLEDNSLYNNIVKDRFEMATNLGWKVSFIFIAIGFLFAVIKVFRRQQYTEYTENEYR